VERLDHKGQKEILVTQVLRDQLVQKDLKEIRELQDQQVLRDRRA
jgi:hypothetical protein